MKIKSRISRKRNIGIHRKTKPIKNRFKKGVSKMEMKLQNQIDDIEFENADFSFMDDIRNIIQNTIKEKRLTEKQIRMSFGVKRYEK